MSWQTWTLFAVTETVLCFVPGPAVLFVLAQALRSGSARTVRCILGIVAANTLYFALSATGIGAILLASYNLFFAVKWLGVAYLVWLGLRTLFGKAKLSIAPSGMESGPRDPRLFLSGLLLQLSNPKAFAFFSALVPQFVDPHRPVVLQVAILAVTSAVIEFHVQLLYAAVAGSASRLVAEPRFARITNRVSGSFLLAAGLGMAALRKS